jgi:hypothetical protein
MHVYNDYFGESGTEKVHLPLYGKVELRDFHKSKYAFGKLLSYQQTLQLGLSAVKVCFHKVLRSQYTDDQSFMEQLFCVIFFQCGERRMMLEGIQDLLMVCKDEQTIAEKKPLLLAWVEEDPASILLKARRENTALPLSEYVMDMHNIISSTFKCSLSKHGNLCIVHATSADGQESTFKVTEISCNLSEP